MVKIISLYLILFLVLFSARSQNVYKSFERLNKKDLYSAQAGFNKKLKRYPAESSLGLSLCYAEPSYLDLDSSLKYLLIAEVKWADVSEKSMAKLAPYAVGKGSIDKQKNILGDLFFKRCISLNEPECFDFLANTQPWNKNISQIVYFRDSLFYCRAKKNKSTQEIKKLLELYPETLFRSKLYALYDNFELNNSIKANTEEEIAAFIELHPENRFTGPLQDSLYRFFHKNDVNLYFSFIQKYPSNRNVPLAWERIYELETNYYHPDLLEFFSNRYPDYPNKKKLAEDMRLSKLQLYPFQDSSSAFGGYGYANEEGDWVIPPRSNFEEPSLFSQGYAVIGKDGLYGVINKSGVEIVPFIYDEVELLENTLILVSSNGLYGLLNRDGSLRHDIEYSQIIDVDSHYYLLYKGEDSGLYCIKNSAALNFDPIDLELLGLGYYRAYGFNGMKVGLFKGHDNCALTEVLPIAYGEINQFDDDSFVGELRNELKIMNASNEKLTDSIYASISPVHNGYALAVKQSKVGYLNSHAQEVIDFEFEPFMGMMSSGLFQGGNAIVKTEGLYGIIDTLGSYKISPKYKQLIYLEGLYGIREDGDWSVLSFTQDSITPAIYSSIDALGNGFVLYKENGKYGMMDAEMNSIFPPVYRSIKRFKNHFVIVGCGDDLHYIMDRHGNPASTKGFSSVQSLTKTHLLVKYDNKIGYFRLTDGKLIIQ